MGRCQVCGEESREISDFVSFCANCISNLTEPEALHNQYRRRFGLPARPPRGGKPCKLCVNACEIPEGSTGFCGSRRNTGGRLMGGLPSGTTVSWYRDPLPTNCVADWVCAGGTGAGYPKFAYSSGPETGYENLAVFYIGCNFDCLFCQNWHWRDALRGGRRSAEEIARAVTRRVSCICYFGGDPSPHLPHALRASRLALERNRGRILRICWETNGAMNPRLLDAMLKLSLKTGGCIKFDLKAFDDKLHRLLCGVTNERTLENFRRASEWVELRPEPPLLVASTLLVPGYVREEEVYKIARFIASLNPDIPYALLAFHPQFCMSDLPTTSRSHAYEAKQLAELAGLRRVRLGNIHLLR